jgi:hypothetical protein
MDDIVDVLMIKNDLSDRIMTMRATVGSITLECSNLPNSIPLSKTQPLFPLLQLCFIRFGPTEHLSNQGVSHIELSGEHILQHKVEFNENRSRIA